MSNEAQAWAWELPAQLSNGHVLTARVKFPLLLMADGANQDFEFLVDHTYLMKHLLMSRIEVEQALAELEELGLISHQFEYSGPAPQGEPNTTVYKLLTSAGQPAEGQHDE